MITTDGMENASSRYDFAKVKQMVEQEQEKDHWQFLFLGANIDVNLTNVEIYKRANIRRQLFSKIISNKDYQPKKETAIVLALAMPLILMKQKTFCQEQAMRCREAVREIWSSSFLLRMDITMFWT